MSGTLASLLPLPRSVFYDANGNPLAGGYVYTYVPGGTTPRATWQDAAETTANANPIVLDAAGSCLLYGSGNYQLTVTDAAGNAVPAYSGLTAIGIPNTITQSGTGALPTALSIVRNGGTVGNSDLVDFTQTVTFVGGTSTLTQALKVESNVGNTYSNGVYVDAPGTDVWNITSRLYSTACVYSGASDVDSQHVATMSGCYRNLPPGGVPDGKRMAQLWAENYEVYDYTQLPSSVAGAISGVEIDCSAGNLDDAVDRHAIQLIFHPIVEVGSGGYPCEWGDGILFSGHSQGGQTDGFVKRALNLSVPYSTSLLDARTSEPVSTTVAAPVSPGATAVAVANVWGFSSAGPYCEPVSPTNVASITINGNPYSQTGFSNDGPGTNSGTIITSGTIATIDGTVGAAVICDAYAIWLPTGGKIAFSTDGAESLFVDSGGKFNFRSVGKTVLTVSSAGELVGSGSVNIAGGIGLYGGIDPGQQVVNGSRGGNAALASLMTALAKYGLVIDNTTA